MYSVRYYKQEFEIDKDELVEAFARWENGEDYYSARHEAFLTKNYVNIQKVQLPVEDRRIL